MKIKISDDDNRTWAKYKGSAEELEEKMKEVWKKHK